MGEKLENLGFDAGYKHGFNMCSTRKDNEDAILWPRFIREALNARASGNVAQTLRFFNIPCLHRHAGFGALDRVFDQLALAVYFIASAETLLFVPVLLCAPMLRLAILAAE